MAINRVEIANGAYPAASGTEGIEHLRLVMTDGRNNAGPCDDHHLVRCLAIYSAIEFTEVKMAFPSAGLLRRMP